MPAGGKGNALFGWDGCTINAMFSDHALTNRYRALAAAAFLLAALFWMFFDLGKHAPVLAARAMRGLSPAPVDHCAPLPRSIAAPNSLLVLNPRN